MQKCSSDSPPCEDFCFPCFPVERCKVEISTSHCVQSSKNCSKAVLRMWRLASKFSVYSPGGWPAASANSNIVVRVPGRQIYAILKTYRRGISKEI